MKKNTKYIEINTNLGYAQWNAPSVTKPNPENCKNCSSKCAYDCAQLSYAIQHRTVLIISPLTSKHHSSDVVYQRRGDTQSNSFSIECMPLPQHQNYLSKFHQLCLVYQFPENCRKMARRTIWVTLFRDRQIDTKRMACRYDRWRGNLLRSCGREVCKCGHRGWAKTQRRICNFIQKASDSM